MVPGELASFTKVIRERVVEQSNCGFGAAGSSQATPSMASMFYVASGSIKTSFDDGVDHSYERAVLWLRMMVG